MRAASPFLLLVPGLFVTAGCYGAGIQSRAASDVQCSTAETEVEEVADGTYRASGCGESGLYYYRQHRYLIGPVNEPSAAALPAEEEQPTPAPLLVPAPSGAGGFSFGSTEDAARTTCERSGHFYEHETDADASCDGVVASVGAPARASLHYCDGKVCTISLLVPLGPGDDPARALVRWKSALGEKYGRPTASKSDVPDRCAEDVTPCLLDGTGTIGFEWRWSTRERVALGLVIDAWRRPWVQIAYDAPAGAPSLRSGAPRG